MTSDEEEQIAILVRGGYLNASEIVETIVEQSEAERADHGELSTFVEATMKQRRKELAVIGRSSYERLRSAFTELAGRGVLVRENYWCCQTCAYAAIDREIADESEKGEAVRGYLLFHAQDTLRAVETGELPLRYGGVTANPAVEGEAASKKIGDEIVTLLQSASFQPRWSGSPNEVIYLPIAWDKRPPLADD